MEKESYWIETCFVAGEYARRLTVLKQVSVETESHWIETCFVAGEYARRLTVLKQVSVETESHWFEKCLLQDNMQSRFPFSIRFRWKQNLTGLRHVYCRRKCKAANCFQTGFGGNRISLVGDMLIARECAKPIPVLNQISVEREAQRLETCLLHGTVQSRFPFSNRFRWKQNLTVLRQVYCRRKCIAANCFQTGFGGDRISTA